ncbi:MAG: bifunctional diaminohydroxyphosphoribosylaminopyrimidine deaminase/5-amino-6-(5-phosphoribosylamino)uracil reductase RibD [candidate division WOR-3 bacterium]|nr:bifunctional diaminohydroxyphosphoribosylaminopyrimidine deaminase/5-amino-6-(5-phosphoribosylamino)uracil reductase RibD [candidate division WOR-3 bacterium]
MNPQSAQDLFYMQKAIELAEKGRGFVSPNPLVGAVIVKNNKIIGQGYHKKFGDAHAEINAIKNAWESVKGATLYVTLEPCNYWEKKTPPCVPAIIEAGIKEVVIGTYDCNPQVCRKGILELQKAGIKIKVGILKDKIEKQNESYFKFTKTGLPFVILKLGVTLDARIATDAGESKWITSAISRRFDQKLRKDADAILVGIGTILKDNPKLTCRIEPKKRLTRVVLDPDLKTPPDAKVLNGPNPTIIFTIKNQKSNIKYQKYQSKIKNLEIIPIRISAGLLSWDDILQELAQRNIASVLIEGGAKVASSALQKGIVDKIYLIYAPKILGKGITFSDYLRLSGLKSVIRLEKYQIIQLGKDFMVEGYLNGKLKSQQN